MFRRRSTELQPGGMRSGSLRMQSRERVQLSSPDHEARKRDLNLADLPSAVLRVLIARKLSTEDCRALFCTSRGTAAAVAAHCRCLTLRPSTTVIWNKRRRQFVLYLAARSCNIHLHVQGTAISLDIAVIWPCIVRLTLDEVVINHGTCSSLHMEQLTRLHTLTIMSGQRFHLEPILAIATLRHVVQAGGLPALRHLCCKHLYDVCNLAPEFVCQLATLLGDRVTWLSVNNMQSLMPVSVWPMIDRLEITDCPRGCAKTIKQLLQHPRLAQISVPAVALLHAFTTESSELHSGTDCDLPELEISGTVSTELLALLPLQHVRHLILPGNLAASLAMDVPALQNLARCKRVQVIPQPWTQLGKQFKSYSTQFGTSAIQAPLSTVILGWLAHVCRDYTGALVLTTDVNGLGMTFTCLSQLRSIAHIPGVHTLIFDTFGVAASSLWVDVINCIPAQVQRLLLRDCNMSEVDFREILDQPAPTGLTHPPGS